MKEILQTEKEMVFLVLLYFHDLMNKLKRNLSKTTVHESFIKFVEIS